MRNGRGGILALLLIPVLMNGVRAAEQPRPDAPLDTVVVEGTRAKLNQMRLELVRLEDRFYARYNALNTNPDFDVHCGDEAPTGSRFAVRNCRAVYASRALQEEGQEDILFRQRINTPPGSGPVLLGGPPPPAVQTIEARREEFQKNMRQVVLRNPELASLLRERHELGQRYEATRRKVFGLKPAPDAR